MIRMHIICGACGRSQINYRQRHIAQADIFADKIAICTAIFCNRMALLVVEIYRDATRNIKLEELVILWITNCPRAL